MRSSCHSNNNSTNKLRPLQGLVLLLPVRLQGCGTRFCALCNPT
jgi:hypothetical protein